MAFWCSYRPHRDFNISWKSKEKIKKCEWDNLNHLNVRSWTKNTKRRVTLQVSHIAIFPQTIPASFNYVWLDWILRFWFADFWTIKLSLTPILQSQWKLVRILALKSRFTYQHFIYFIFPIFLLHSRFVRIVKLEIPHDMADTDLQL